jgi:hypothetical protein
VRKTRTLDSLSALTKDIAKKEVIAFIQRSTVSRPEGSDIQNDTGFSY